jgi:hypothetical protein
MAAADVVVGHPFLVCYLLRGLKKIERDRCAVEEWCGATKNDDDNKRSEI